MLFPLDIQLSYALLDPQTLLRSTGPPGFAVTLTQIPGLAGTVVTHSFSAPGLAVTAVAHWTPSLSSLCLTLTQT